MRLPTNAEITRGFDEECRATREILDLVGDKWSVLVVVNLGAGTRRFSALRRGIDGISKRVLTATLRRLERDGVVSRTVYAEVPPRVEYALTQMGTSLIAPVTTLAMWAQEHREEVLAARQVFDARR